MNAVFKMHLSAKDDSRSEMRELDREAWKWSFSQGRVKTVTSFVDADGKNAGTLKWQVIHFNQQTGQHDWRTEFNGAAIYAFRMGWEWWGMISDGVGDNVIGVGAFELRELQLLGQAAVRHLSQR